MAGWGLWGLDEAGLGVKKKKNHLVNRAGGKLGSGIKKLAPNPT